MSAICLQAELAPFSYSNVVLFFNAGSACRATGKAAQMQIKVHSHAPSHIPVA